MLCNSLTIPRSFLTSFAGVSPKEYTALSGCKNAADSTDLVRMRTSVYVCARYFFVCLFVCAATRADVKRGWYIRDFLPDFVVVTKFAAHICKFFWLLASNSVLELLEEIWYWWCVRVCVRLSLSFSLSLLLCALEDCVCAFACVICKIFP